jgi:large subunit ribosomal protein L9
MKVILRQDVDKLGKALDVKDVKPGFARNFLFLKNLAYPATEENLKKVKMEKESLENRKKQEKSRLTGLAEKLSGISFNISAQTGDNGRLFGSITKDDIAGAIKKESGIAIDRHDIELEEPIKMTGAYFVDAKLKSDKFPEEISRTVKVKVWVVGG